MQTHPRPPLRTALIGVGGFAASHLARLRSGVGASSCQLVAVADPNLLPGSEGRQLLERDGYRVHLSLAALLERESFLDAVVISTPLHLHEEMTAACLARGLCVLLEKPAVPLLQQLDPLVALEERSGGRVAVSFQRIAAEPSLLAKRWLVERRVGRVREIRVHACWPRLDAYYGRAAWAGKMVLGGRPVFDGPATNALAHAIHQLMFLAGEHPESFAMPVMMEGEFYRVRPTIESYDLVCLRGQLTGGATYHVAMTHACCDKTPFVVEVRGDDGWICLGDSGQSVSTSWGHHQLFSSDQHNPYDRIYANLAEITHSRDARPYTTLEDTRGYLLATNGGLLASDGIHAVHPRFFERFGEGEQAGYVMAGGTDFIREASSQMKLFSEMELPWAIPGRKIDAQGLHGLTITPFEEVTANRER